MLKSARPVIRLRGVRHNNLKNFDLDLPLNRLIVVTGLSGSGKSSLAFDTLFAEGQRRYIETFSPYARQFLDRMDKPAVDSIEGIPPAIAIEQRNSVRTTRSTVGTMTEICDYMKTLWPHVAQLYCRQCGQPVRKDSPTTIWECIRAEAGSSTGANTEVLITFDLPLTEKLSLQDSLALVAKQGYQRLLCRDEIIRIDETSGRIAPRAACLTVIQDRVKLTDSNRTRFIEACEQAYHFGKGKLAIHAPDTTNSKLKTENSKLFSNRLHCPACDLEYQPPSPALFSFNHPVGACPTCRGFGRVISIDYNLALPDPSKTLAQGVVKPWQSGMSAECQTDLMRMCRHFGVPTNVPFARLDQKWQDFVISGEPDYGKDEEHEWPRAWYGIKGYFRWLESKAYKMHVRVLLSRYRTYTPCPDCRGTRFQPEALLYRIPANDGLPNGRTPAQSATPSPELTLPGFYQLPIRDALKFITGLEKQTRRGRTDPLALALTEVRARLGYLDEVGLGYLTLDRPTRSLSGGETERVSLTTCLGTRLVNTLFVLDEPSVGLHPRDTERLVRVLQQLRDAGNTVLVVEHEPCVMRAADEIVDLGPGHGATGGQVVFQGPFSELLKSAESLTGQYLSGKKRIEIMARRPVGANVRRLAPPLQLNEAIAPYGLSSNTTGKLNGESGSHQLSVEQPPRLRISHATRHNLTDLSVEIPLGRLVCVTGVSGSGKTTLVREVLLPALAARLSLKTPIVKASDRLAPDANGQENGEEDSDERAAGGVILEGHEALDRAVLVDQSILSKTPRSNPAVYAGAFDDIREAFARTETARQRGLNASAFSFNSTQGQCERCRGAGFEKIEMQFLSDVFIRCPDCAGRRYRSHILEVKITPTTALAGRQSPRAARHAPGVSRPLSIADLLDSTIEEAGTFLRTFTDSRPAQRAARSLNLLCEVGLGYLKLGQPINTLSGGESQRLKLVRELAEADPDGESRGRPLLRNGAAEGGREKVGAVSGREGSASSHRLLQTLFLFDEPTTGLHFDDVRLLLKVFQRLVDAGHSVLVIEHNLEVIKAADWVIDLGPDAGDQGGQLVAEGTPEQIATCNRSHTGRALREVLSRQTPTTSPVRYRKRRSLSRS